jgi:glutathione S-transferase
MDIIKIYYWPMLARASGLFRMCAQAGIEWEHVTDAKQMNCALFGASTLNLAPPIIRDGQVTISQSIACHTYLGNKFGFDKDIPFPELALQYMNDLNDLHDEMKAAAMKGEAAKDIKYLQKYIEGDRYKTHLATINRQIKGPFYFGNEPTYVDFYASSMFEMCEGRWLNPLIDKTGDTLNAYAPKLRLVLEGIRGMGSASKLKDIPPLLPSRVLTSERVATWKSRK